MNYYDFIKKTVYYMNINGDIMFSFDDLIQDGYFGYLKALSTYKNDKNCSFETYARLKIRGHIIDKIRHYNKYKLKHDIRHVSEIFLNEKKENIMDLDNKIDMENLLNRLNEKERNIIKLIYYRGYTFKHVGKIYGISESRISHIHKKTINKLRLKLKIK